MEKQLHSTQKSNYLEKQSISFEFRPRQEVMINPFYLRNVNLPDGIEPGIIYMIDEIETCKCGEQLLVLHDAYDPGTKERICLCGQEGFKPNAFFGKRFIVISQMNTKQLLFAIDKSLIFFLEYKKYVDQLLELRYRYQKNKSTKIYKDHKKLKAPC